MADQAPNGLDDLDWVQSGEQFAEAARLLHARKGMPTLREIERKSKAAQEEISPGGANALLKGERWPVQKAVRGFLAGVGADKHERAAFLAAWARLKAASTPPAAPPSDRPGASTARMLTHDKVLQALTDQHLYGKGMQVPFLSPGPDHGADPARVMRDLESCDDEVVLLVGRAGAGKTRTCVEVATLAQQDGWRVLHVTAGPKLNHRDLADAVLGEPAAATLLVIDNVDKCRQFDLTHFVTDVGDAMAPHGGELRLLAATRPSLLGQVVAAGTKEFHRIDLLADEVHERARAEHIFEAVAPHAFEDLEPETRTAICGEHPVIVLLLAHDLEVRARPGEADRLDEGRSALIRWLHRRLQENGLISEDAEVSRTMLASALAAATCPASPEEVVAAVRPLFGAGDDGDTMAAEVVDELEVMEWLELAGDSYRVVHDIVTDELLSGALLDAGRQRVNKDVLRELLDCLVDQPAALDRFAGNLARAHAELRPLPQRQIADVCSVWTAAHATRLGRLFADEPDNPLYIMLHTDLWHGPVVANWTALVEPMLRDNAGTGSAELAAALLDQSVRQPVLTSALIWLARHSADEDADDVLVPLLAHAGLTADQRAGVARHALDWVLATRAENDATRVLRLLLERPTVSARLNHDVVAAAFSWLARNPQTPNADFVIRPLLSHGKLTKAESWSVIHAAFQWLDRYATALKASHLLKQLVVRCGELSPEERDRTLNLVWRWMDGHGLRDKASFLLKPLLEQRLRDRQALATALRCAESWLTANLSSPSASFVLRRMFAVPGLPPDRLEVYVRHGLAWLDQCGPEVDQSFVLRELIVRCERRADVPGELVDAAHVRARDWLDAGSLRHGSGYVWSALLSSRRLSPMVRATFSAEGLTWLRSTPDDEDSRPWMLEALLRLPMPDPAAGRAAVEAALHWLPVGAGRNEAAVPRVLSALLDRVRTTGVHVDRAMAEADRWLTDHPSRRGTPIVLAAALRHGPGADPGGRFRDLATAWLTAQPGSWLAPTVLHALTHHDHLDAGRRHQLFELLLSWTHDHPYTRSAAHTLRTILQHPGVAAEQADAAVHATLAFVDLEPGHPAVAPLIRAMLGCRAVNDGVGDSIVAVTVPWLRAHREHPDTPELVRELTRMCAWAGLGRDRADQVLALTMELVHDHADDRWAATLLGSMLTSPGIDPVLSRQVVARVAEWLAGNRDHPAVPYGMLVLLRDPSGPTREAVDAAVDWLTRNPDAPGVRQLLPALVDTAGLDPAAARTLTGSALSWMASRPGNPRVPLLLALLLADVRLGSAGGAAVEELLNRLAGHLEGQAAPELFRLIGTSAWTGQDHRERAADIAFQWLDTDPGGSTASDLLVVVIGKLRPGAASRARAAALALNQLDRRPHDPGAPHLIRAVLVGDDIRPSDARRATAHAFAWLRRAPVPALVPVLLRTLTSSGALTPGELDQALEETMRWLEAHPAEPAADLLRMLSGNRRLPDGAADRVLATILTRLDRAAGAFPDETPDLLRAAAMSSRLNPVALDRLIGIAVPWLTRHGHHPGAPEVVGALAVHAADSDDVLAGGIRGWLREHRADQAIPGVVGRLVTTPGAGQAILDEAVEAGLGWLDAHNGHPDALELLGKIACSALVPPVAAEYAGARALAWAAGHPSDPGVPTLLRLLAMSPSATTADRAAQAAIDWSRQNPEHPEVLDLLRRVAAGGSVTTPLADRAARAAIDWAGQHEHDPATPASLVLLSLSTRLSTPCADLVVSALINRAADISRSDLIRFLAAGTRTSAPVAARAATLALDRVARDGDDRESFELLHLLVRSRLLPTDAMDRVVGEALAWVARQADDPAAPTMLGGLLEGVRAVKRPADDVVTGALGWLVGHPDSPDSPRLYEKLLQTASRTPGPIMQQVAAATLGWLSARRHQPIAALPLAQLLLRPGPGLLHALPFAADWLAEHGDAPRAKDVATSLLTGPAPANFAIEHAGRWLAAHRDHPGVGEVAARLIEQADTPAERLPALLTLALDWLDANLGGGGVPLLLSALLRYERHTSQTADRSAEATLSWLKLPGRSPVRRGDRGQAAVVLSLLCAPALGVEHDWDACHAGLRWLGPIAGTVPEPAAPPAHLDRRSLARHLTEHFADLFPPLALDFARATLFTSAPSASDVHAARRPLVDR